MLRMDVSGLADSSRRRRMPPDGQGDPELAQRLSGNRPTAADHRMLTDLGAAVAEDQFTPLAGAPKPTVAMPYHVPIPGNP